MKALSQVLRGVIRLYQVTISPYMPMNCRYQPSCSSYARQALEHHGPVTGSWLALRRISRCHPWGGHGYDPIPEIRTSSARPGA